MPPRKAVNTSQNRRGQGTIWKDCDHQDWSRCECPWRLTYRDPVTGKQAQASITGSQTDAWDEIAKRRAAKGSSRLRDETFGNYADKWLERKRSLKPSSRKRYEISLRLHLKPQIGPSTNLRKINRHTLHALVDYFEDTGLSGQYISDIWNTVLIPILRSAAADGYMDPINTKGIELPKIVKKIIYVPNFDEVDKLIVEMGFAITLMAGCGLRLGEALGVSEACFLGDHVLRVKEQWLESNELGPLKHRDVGDFRDVPLPDYVLEMKEKHLPARDGYLFPGTETYLVSHRSFKHKLARKIINEKLDKRITPHTFRHWFVSNALDGGADITQVARWLGHTTIQETYNTYGHLLKPSFGRTASAIDARLRGDGDSSVRL